ncbi:hypothetical protein BBJ28_00017864 [Nothophytophthora sp. Chile5]|nr:hypothetical protein BBJ28_00017864 [Nothophytophthora sp. Chile5]
MKTLTLFAMGALQLPLAALGICGSLGFNETSMAATDKGSVSFAAVPFDLRTDLSMAEGVTTHAAANDDYSTDSQDETCV